MTQEKLKALFDYDKNTGNFIRRYTTSSNAKKNTIAGYINKDGYVKISIDGKKYLAHRLVWLYVYGYMPTQIDHIDHNRANNTLHNLRDITQKENTKNTSLRKDNTTGISGIYYDKKRKSFKVQIAKDGKDLFFGRYKNFNEAVKVRNSAYFELNYHENHGKDL